MTDDAIKAVARALHIFDMNGNAEDSKRAWGEEEPGDAYQEYYRAKARAAIAAMPAPAVVQEPVAFVPIHPRLGPLWSETYPAGKDVQEDRPSYPVKPIYAAPVPPQEPAEVERLTRALNPRLWSRDMIDAWHRAIPNVQKAFDDLRAAALRSTTGDA